MNCRECIHCGQNRGKEIQCDNPAWSVEPHMRYLHPVFADRCKDFAQKQDRWILLNADDVHQEGDEVWNRRWIPIHATHIGGKVGKVGEDYPPCRRRAI